MSDSVHTNKVIQAQAFRLQFTAEKTRDALTLRQHIILRALSQFSFSINYTKPWLYCVHKAICWQALHTHMYSGVSFVYI